MVEVGDIPALDTVTTVAFAVGVDVAGAFSLCGHAVVTARTRTSYFVVVNVTQAAPAHAAMAGLATVTRVDVASIFAFGHQAVMAVGAGLATTNGVVIKTHLGHAGGGVAIITSGVGGDMIGRCP